MKFKQTIVIAGAALAALAAATAAQAYDGQQYAEQATVSLEQARQIALKAVPGASIADQELEHEKGGSGLRYSFDIRQGAVTHEVGIDAVSGRVLENSVEGPNSD